DGREMNADLMCPAGVQLRSQEIPRFETGEPEEVRLRQPSATDDCHTLSVSRVARDRAIDRNSVLREMAADHHCVASMHASRGESCPQNPERTIGLRDDEESRRVLVEAMNNAGALRQCLPSNFRAPAKESVDEGSGPVA